MKKIVTKLLFLIITGNAAAQKDRITLLNAANFDFGDTKAAGTYLGHLNLYAPSCSSSNDGTGKWGFNTGIMKINYANNDTLDNTRGFENVQINPWDQLVPGSRYLRQYNDFKKEIKNTVWSFYVQPMYELTHKTAAQHVYMHAHFELLATHWRATTTVTVLHQDTLLFDATTPPVRAGLNGGQSVFKNNLLNGYFGLGATFDLDPFKIAKSNFFFQPTFGVTDNYPSIKSSDINGNTSNTGFYPVITSNRKWHAFYLVRAYYSQEIGEAKLIVGMDIRGIFPRYAPQYAAYIGVNLNLSSLMHIFGETVDKDPQK